MDNKSEKEVYISPISFSAWTQHPLKFKLAHLTSTSFLNQLIDPLAPLLAVLQMVLLMWTVVLLILTI